MVVITSYSIHYTKLYDLACWLLLAIALLLTLPLPFTVSLIADLDWGPVWAGYLAALLLADPEESGKVKSKLVELGLAGGSPGLGMTCRVCPGNHECKMGLSATRDRITSYNVCYTKLLRPTSISNFAPFPRTATCAIPTPGSRWRGRWISGWM